MAHHKNRNTSNTLRVVVIAIASVYLLFSVGILKATHFCMGREVSIVFFSAEAAKCACSSFAPKEKSCCDDQHDLIRLKDDQRNISSYALSLPHLSLITNHAGVFLAAALQSVRLFNDYVNPTDTSPPKIPLFKIHCSFIFYDNTAAAA
jgi:hypothetical protein